MEEIRIATMDDLDQIAALEAVCFPPAEAASKKQFRERLSVFGDHFWLLFVDGQLASCINGMVTDRETICDEMFADAGMHDEGGKWQSLFGVMTHPSYQRQGYAAKLMEHVIAESRKQGRKGVILTCKDRLIHYYAKFGYENQGVSGSEHGGAVWYDMTLTF